jgi:ATP-dependent Lhr-like helicase
MIRDERTYRVVEATRRSVVGSLDEDFVLSYIEPGAQFVMRGRTWDVLEVQEDAVLVAEGKTLGAIPSWTGEDLPVPWSVALEVGRMRRLIAAGERGTLLHDYPLEPDALASFEAEVTRNTRKSLALGTDQELVIESGDRIVVINACFGTRPNQTLGRLLEALLAQRLAAGVRLTTDAYRIVLEGPQELRAELVEQTLRSIDPDQAEALLRVVVRNSNFLRYHLLHTARVFGAVGKDLDPSRFSVRRLLEVYREMPLFEEAIEKVLWETMDAPNVRNALSMLAAGRFAIRRQGLSPVGLLGIEKERRLLSPAEEEPSILKALQERLTRSKIILVCVVCGQMRATTVDRTPGRPECNACHSIMVAPLHPNEREVARLVRRKERTPEEEKRVKRAVAAAHLVATYGKEAVIVLSGRGVGPENGARILGKHSGDEMALLRGVLQAEVQFAKTRRFWD